MKKILIWAAPKIGNKYTELLYDKMEKRFEVEVDNFSKKDFFKSFLNFKKHANILHMHWPEHWYSYYGVIETIVRSFLMFSLLVYLKILGTKIIWTVHNIYPHECKHKVLEKYIRSKILLLSDGIIVHSFDTKKKLESKFNCKKPVVVINCGHFRCYESNISKEKLKNHYNLEDGKFIYLWIGQISPYKGVDRLIDCFKELRLNDSILLIVGKSSPNTDIKKLYKIIGNNKNIILDVRFIPDQEIKPLLELADVLVLPFREITTSASLILGLSYGKPIIAPRIGCIPEYVNNSAGILYYPNNRKMLKDSLQKIRNCNLSKISQNAIKMTQKLEWDKIAQKTVNFYRRILKEPKI